MPALRPYQAHVEQIPASAWTQPASQPLTPNAQLNRGGRGRGPLDISGNFDNSSMFYFVATEWFQVLAGCIIVANIFMIAAEASDEENTKVLYWPEQVMLTFYLIELLLRVGYFKRNWLCGEPTSVAWNILDLVVVTSGVVDQWIMPLLRISLNTRSLYEALRLLRVLRVLKVVRIILEADLTWTEGTAFQTFIATVITFNTIIMGLEADYPHASMFFFIEQGLLLIYVFELVARIKRARCMDFFWRSEDVHWNVLDFTIVVSSVSDQWLMPSLVLIMNAAHNATGGTDNHEQHHNATKGLRLGQIMMLMRMLRLMRILRILRLVKSVRPLYNLVMGMIAAMQGVFWVLLLTVVTLYSFGIIMTRLIGHGMIFAEGNLDHLNSREEELIQIHFATVGESMFLLFKLMNGSQSDTDAEALDLLMTTHPMTKFGFVFFMVTSSWTLLSILTAVVSDNMVKTTSKQESETKILVADQEREEQVDLVKSLIDQIVRTDPEFLSMQQVEAFFSEPGRAQDCARVCNMSVRDVMKFARDMSRGNHGGWLKADDFTAALVEGSSEVKQKSLFSLELKIQQSSVAHRQRLEDMMAKQEKWQHQQDTVIREALQALVETNSRMAEAESAKAANGQSNGVLNGRRQPPPLEDPGGSPDRTDSLRTDESDGPFGGQSSAQRHPSIGQMNQRQAGFGRSLWNSVTMNSLSRVRATETATDGPGAEATDGGMWAASLWSVEDNMQPRWPRATGNRPMQSRDVGYSMLAQSEYEDGAADSGWASEGQLVGLDDLFAFVEEPKFQFLVAAVIVANTFMMAAEASSKAASQILYWPEQVVLCFYGFELISRALHFRGHFLWGLLRQGKEVQFLWNTFDLALVGAGVLDQWIMPVMFPSVNSSWLGSLRVLRLLRMLRIVRIFLDADLSFTEEAGFQSLIGGAIAFNALLMGLETDYPDNELWSYLEHALLIIYVFEIMVRLRRDSWEFFSNDDYMWNWLDFSIVVSSVADQWVIPSVLLAISGGEASIGLENQGGANIAPTIAPKSHGEGGGGESKGSIRLSHIMMLMRMLRLMRILRIARLVKRVQPLYNLVMGMLDAMQGVFWVLMLTLVVVYTTGIVATQVIGHGAIFSGEDPEREMAMREPFNGLANSMFFLFNLMNGSQSTSDMEALDLLMGHYPYLKFGFVFFMVMTSWTLLSILTAVVSERMITTTGKQERELNILLAEEERQVNAIAARKMFDNIAIQAGSTKGRVNTEELDDFLNDPDRAHECVKVFRMPPRDVANLMRDHMAHPGAASSSASKSSDHHMGEFLDIVLEAGDDVKHKSLLKIEQRIERLNHETSQQLVNLGEKTQVWQKQQSVVLENVLTALETANKAAEMARQAHEEALAAQAAAHLAANPPPVELDRPSPYNGANGSDDLEGRWGTSPKSVKEKKEKKSRSGKKEKKSRSGSAER